MIDVVVRALFLTLAGLVVLRLAMLAARADLPAAYGALVMAVGIFVHAAWGRLPFASTAATGVLALLLIAMWLVLAASYAGTAVRGRLSTSPDGPIARFALGTWVAATAVVGVVVQQVFPSWHSLVAALTVVVALLWIWYLALVARSMRAIVAGPWRQCVTGIVLLATVSTQAVAILVQLTAPAALAGRVCPPLIVLGCALYTGGLVLILRRYGREPGSRLADDWDNTNGIIHGAVSITGLAAVSSGVLPPWGMVVGWLWALALFVVVEGIELVRLYGRVATYGWRRGALTYDVSQWARNFTFGMFCAFTLALYAAEAGAGIPDPVLTLQEVILRYGQYAVLALLVVELGLFLA